MSSDATTTAHDTSASDALARADDLAVGEHRTHHKEPTDRQYLFIALFLAFLTALEIAATEAGVLDGAPLVVVLIALMVVKFLFVILFFMHLRFDSRLFSLVFYIGLFLAVALYVAVLATFHFFSS
jgi:cytochrome c oxidase subunit 4